MTTILDKCVCVCAHKSNTIKIKLEFMYICIRGNDYDFTISYSSCCDGVVYLVMH